MKLELAACLFALAACGSDAKPGHAVDAGDGAADATEPPDAPAAGVVTIRFPASGGMSYAGLPVSFAGPDGKVTSETVTDANGTASATVVAGSSVTAQYTPTLLLTILHVQPGDNLVLDIGGATPTPEGAVTVTSDTYNVMNPTYRLYAGGGTEANTTSAGFTLTSAQLDAANHYNVVGLVTTTTNGVTTPVAYATKFGLVPPMAGGPSTVAMPAWRTDFDTMTVAIANAANDAKDAIVEIAPIAGTQTYVFDATTLDTTFTNGAAGGSLALPKGAFTSYALRAQVDSTNNHSGTIGFFAYPAAGLAQIDASQMLPFIHDPVLTLPAGAKEPKFQYLADGPLTQGFGALYLLSYQAAGGTVQRYVIDSAPAAATQLPDLGVAQAAFEPATPFTPGGQNAAVVVSGGPWSHDAKDFRENWYRLLVGLESFPTSLSATEPYLITIAQ